MISGLGCVFSDVSLWICIEVFFLGLLFVVINIFGNFFCKDFNVLVEGFWVKFEVLVIVIELVRLVLCCVI